MRFILPTLQLVMILVYLWMALRARKYAPQAYVAGWRDGQLRFVSLVNEFAARPDVDPSLAYVAAVKSALQEDPMIGKTHLPWRAEK
jgi:hypothetical protein